MIYLDNSATTYPKPQCVYESIDYANKNLAFNAGRGSYPHSSSAMKIIDETRMVISDYINVESRRVIFTSSATESLNMIINGISLTEGDNVYVSVFEHNAVLRPLYQKKGINIHIIPLSITDWSLNKLELKNMFAVNKPKAIILSQVSNVTGYELPYEDIFEMGSAYDSINILDAAQSYGILKPEIKFCHYLVFAGHKSLYSMFGVAGFIKLKNDLLTPTKYGGTGTDSLNKEMPKEIPYRYESGSYNVVAIASLLASAKWIIRSETAKHEYELAQYLIEKLKKLKNVKIFLPDTIKTLGIVSIGISGYSSDDVADILYEEYGICLRSGYHCSPLVHDFIGSKKYGGTVRISIGAFNTIEEINSLIDAIKSFE